MRKNNRNEGAEQLGEPISGLAAFSLLVFLIDKLADKIYGALANGFFGKIFTAYSSEQRSFEQGFLRNHFISTKFNRNFRKFRQYLSRTFESSRILNQMRIQSDKMLAIPLKAYGRVSFAFGVYTILIALIRWLNPDLTNVSSDYVWIGVGVCVASIPLLLSYDSLKRALGKGCITGMLCRDAFGFRESSFSVRARISKARNSVLMLCGLLLGLLTFFVHPVQILLFLIGIVLIAVVFSSPEIGVLLSIFILPFLSFLKHPALALGILIGITAISYLVKLVCGKRILKFELLDLSVVLFWILLQLSGILSAGGKEGFREVMLSSVLMIGYFLVVNLMRTENWLTRCVKALVASGTLVAIYGIFQYLFGIENTGNWLDASYFYDIRGRVVSLFENPNVLAAYLLLVLPFALFLLVRSVERKARLLSWISILSVLLCLLLTWSRGAWIAALLCMLVFALFYSKKTLRWLFCLALSVPFLSLVLPRSVVRRFLSIGNLADSSTSYRVYTWKGTWNAIKEQWLGGYGYGSAAYKEIYPQFAYAGMEAAEHSHNLFLQLWLGMGVGGLLVFLIVIFLATQMMLEYLKVAKNQESKWRVLACLCAVFASLVMGLFDFVWYNYRVFFLFWIVLGLACAGVRIGMTEQRKREFQFVHERPAPEEETTPIPSNETDPSEE